MKTNDLLTHYSHLPIIMGTKPIKPDQDVKIELDKVNQVLLILPADNPLNCSDCGKALAVYERRNGRCNDCTTKIYREVRKR